MATKNKSILLNDKYMLTATSQYKKLMSIGQERIDEIVVTASQRANYRSGGR